MKQLVKLKDIASYSKGTQINGEELIDEAEFDYLNGGINPSGKWNEANCEGNTITISEGGNSCGYINFMRKSFWCGAHCYYLYDTVKNTQYLYYALKSQQDKIMKLRSGACMPNIKKVDLGNFEFWYDNDINEQERITTILSKLESVIELRKQELSFFDLIISARFVEMFGNPDVNEYNWGIYKMEELCDIGSSKRIYQNEQSRIGIPFLRISDLVNRMETGSKESDLYIPESRFEELKKQGLVPKSGDILLTARGTLGRCYIIQDDDEFYFQDGMITWLSKYDAKVIPLYISYLFEMPGFRKQIDSLQAGSTVAYLSIYMTKKLDIMLPPIELQNQFADFVKHVDKSKVAVEKALEETQLLFDSLMQQYFG